MRVSSCFFRNTSDNVRPAEGIRPGTMLNAFQFLENAVGKLASLDRRQEIIFPLVPNQLDVSNGGRGSGTEGLLNPTRLQTVDEFFDGHFALLGFHTPRL